MLKTLNISFIATALILVVASPILLSVISLKDPTFVESLGGKFLFLLLSTLASFIAAFQLVTFFFAPSAMIVIRLGITISIGVIGSSLIGAFIGISEVKFEPSGKFQITASSMGWPTVTFGVAGLIALVVFAGIYLWLRMPDNYDWASRYN